MLDGTCKMEQDTGLCASVLTFVVSVVSMHLILRYLQREHIASMKAPPSGNQWPVWLAGPQLHRHHNKREREPTREAGDRTRKRENTAVKPHNPPPIDLRQPIRAMKERKRGGTWIASGWLGLAFESGAVQDQNWRVKRVRGFVPELYGIGCSMEDILTLSLNEPRV